MFTFSAQVAETGEQLLERVHTALSFWQRLRGLMLRRRLQPGHGMLFPHCSSVHTCLMRFPIDVIYLSADNEVLKVVPSIKPWRLSLCPGAESVLEGPAGTADRAGLEPGHHVQFEFAPEVANPADPA